MAAANAYRPSPVNRDRWTDARLADLDETIVAVVEADHPVTLRGVFYRASSAGAVGKDDAGYKRVGRQLLKLRRDGTIPYPWITDGTRWITKPTTWASLDDKLAHDQRHYRRALWHDSSDEVQIFTEKDAISGVLLPVTDEWDVPLGVLRGYSSESFAHSCAASIVASNSVRAGFTYVYQLGDHDPSGVDAWRDFTEKVAAFIVDESDDIAEFVRFERLAVTVDQIAELGLPTRPTKSKDTRARDFVGGSVEVDAIPAPNLREIVRAAIFRHIDSDRLDRLRAVEAEERDGFARMREIFGGAA